MSDEVTVTTEGSVAIITINRPRAKNAVNSAVAAGIASAVDELDTRDDLAVGVLTGAGGTFCAGMDLKGFLSGDSPEVAGRGFGGLTQKPAAKPMIAAIEGYALAGGFELALACDLLVAARDAKLGLPEVTRGLVAGAGGLLRLPHRIPFHLAMEIALTGSHVEASRLEGHGLFTAVTEPGGALEAAKNLAERIAANAPLALAATKRVVNESADWKTDEAFAKQMDIIAPVFGSEDAMEGAAAFAEKRKPNWRGK